MARDLGQVNSASGTFRNWLDKTNSTINSLATEVVTANAAANGALTTGNGVVNGIFGSTTLFASTALRGGNVQSSANLAISSNLVFSGNILTLNTAAVLSIGVLQINSTSLLVGNSTVNSVINSSSITVGNATYTTLMSGLVVANTGTTIGTRKKINFSNGTNVILAISEDVGNSQINVQISASLSGSAFVGGNNTEVQFANTGNFGGNSQFTFNVTTGALYVSNSISTNNYFLVNSKIASVNTTTTGTSSQLLDTCLTAETRSVEYVLSIKDNAANGYQTNKLLVLHDGGDAYLTEFGTIISNTNLVTYTANSNTTHIRLYAVPTSANTTIKGQKTLVNV